VETPFNDLDTYREQFLSALNTQNRDGALALIDSALQAGFPPKLIILRVISAALDTIGERQAHQEITLSEVFLMARISDAALERLLQRMREKPETRGTVIVASATGDYHSLGRKILCSFLRVGGFRVVDLGASVASATIVDRAVSENAAVICVSALLLHTAQNITEVRELIDTRNLKDQIKLVVGGAVFNMDPQLFHSVGADATARNAPAAVAVVRSMFKRDAFVRQSPFSRTGAIRYHRVFRLATGEISP